MITVSYMDLYDETQAEGGAESCKYLLKDIQASVNFTAMTIRGDAGFLWHQLRQNKSKRQA
mgnify:FL=1